MHGASTRGAPAFRRRWSAHRAKFEPAQQSTLHASPLSYPTVEGVSDALGHARVFPELYRIVIDESDREALALLRRRDARGFDLAYAAHAARIYAFLVRLSGRRDVADDLLQHTFLRLAERGPELRSSSDLRAWLFTVARNAYFSYTRHTMHREATSEGLEPDAATEGGELALESRLLLADVQRALSTLRSEDRELLLLVGVEGMEPSDVARILGVDAATVRQRLARARARLIAELKRQAEIHTPGDTPQ